MSGAKPLSDFTRCSTGGQGPGARICRESTKVQIATLKRSVHEWNQWRANNPSVVPDLRRASCRRTAAGWARYAANDEKLA
jgi:hypothetical protein